MEAICRNFGGLTDSMFDKYMFEMILTAFDLKDDHDDVIQWKRVLCGEMSALNLIRANITQSMSKDNNPETQNYDMRHVMLITDTEALWKYLYEMDILQHNTSTVIFGNQFKNDQNSLLYLHQNLDKIKNAIVKGHTIVLLHLDYLYNSLYDVLNQRYWTIGSKRFSNIWIRNEMIRVQIHPSFRFIIVIPTTHAHHTAKDCNVHTPVVFLNRFEKHYLSLKNLCGTRKNCDQLLQRLETEIEGIFGSVPYSQVFVGFVNRLTFASVLIYAETTLYGSHKAKRHGIESIEEDDDDDECKMMDPDIEIINYSIALLLSNCYLRHFINHKSEDLYMHTKLKPTQRQECFSSIQDVMQHYTSHKMGQEDGEITLIRVTTHDSFQHVSDFKKHFQIRRRIDDHDENDNDTEHKAPSNEAFDNVMLINIGAIASSSEFVGVINEFLVNKESHTLIIQTTNNNHDEFLRNLHVQYLIEQAKYAAKSEASANRTVANKQVVVIVYMNRLITGVRSKNDAEAVHIQSRQYPLIFNCGWRQIYCDAILPSQIEITDLNINDAYSRNLFALRIGKYIESVIESTFEIALNDIHFPTEMHEEVDRITKIFYDANDKRLKRAIIARVKEILCFSYYKCDFMSLDVIKSLLKRVSDWSDVSVKRGKGNKMSRQSSDDIIERGSFRQMVILQLSEEIASEMMDILVGIFNHHSSELYRPQYQLQPHEEREASKKDIWMTNIWLVLLSHKSGIVRAPSKLNGPSHSSHCHNVETTLKVEFPFSLYIDAYFHHIQRDIVSYVLRDGSINFKVLKRNKEIQVNVSGHKGQLIVAPIIQNHLYAAGYDFLLSINKYIEWYVHDVSVLQLQKQLGLRYSEWYFAVLTRFIHQFILCAAHETHDKLIFEDRDDDDVNSSSSSSSEEVADVEDSDDNVSSSSSEEVAHVKEPDDEKKHVVSENVEEVIPYPYALHEIYAALWCNEQLLQKLI
eukprot:789175_1